MKKKMTQTETDGRKVAGFCAKRPRTIAEIQSKLGGAKWGRARRAIKWVTDRRNLSENPFLCVPAKGRYLYGFRNDFDGEIVPYLKREFRYDMNRLSSALGAIEHSLLTTDSLAMSLGKAERTTLNRWRRIMAGQQAAAEQVVAELEEVLAA